MDCILFEITSTNVKFEDCAKGIKHKYLYQSLIICDESSNEDDGSSAEENDISVLSWEGKKNGAPQPEIGPGYVVETKKSQFVCDSNTNFILQMVKSVNVDES